MKNVLIIGCYHSLNSGVMAMAESLVQNIPDAKFYIMSSNKYLKRDEERYANYSNVEIYNIEWFERTLTNYMRLILGFFNISLFKNFNSLISEIDLVIDISGDSISSDYSMRSIFISLFPVYLIKDKIIIYAPQTIGPFNSAVEKYLVKKALKKAKKIFLREKVSLEYFEDLKINVPIEIKADLAFSLKPKENEKEIPNKTIGVGVSSLIKQFGKEKSHQMFKNIIDRCLLKDFKVLLITHVDAPHSNDVDYGEEIKELYYSTNNDVIFLNKNFTASEWKYIIGQCKGVISARMHPVVQAISQSIPSLNISYNHKSKGVVQDRFYPYGQIRDMNDTDLINSVNEFLNNVNEYYSSDDFAKRTKENIDLAKQFINYVSAL